MLNVQKFLTTNSLESLVDKYKLICKTKGDLVILQYHQLDTPKNDITNECRALILDKSNNFKVVCKSFTRFNDYSPKTNTNFDLSNFKRSEKIDGSLINMWWYDNQWNVSTKSEIKNDNVLKDIGLSINDFFWKTWKELKYDLPTDTSKTYIFEFKYPSQHQFITHCNKPMIKLIGASDLTTFADIDTDTITDCNWDKIKQETVLFDDLLKEVSEIDPIECEGFVIRDINGNRLKVKSPQFDAIALLQTPYETAPLLKLKQMEENNQRRIWDIVRWNGHKNFLTKYPHCLDIYNKSLKQYKKKLNDIESVWEKVKDLSNREIGQYLKEKKCENINGLIFALYAKKVESVEEYLKKQSLSGFIEIIKK